MNAGKFIVYADRVRFYLSLIQFGLVLWLTVKAGLDLRVLIGGALLVPLILYADIKRVYSQDQKYRTMKNPIFLDILASLDRIEEAVVKTEAVR